MSNISSLSDRSTVLQRMASTQWGKVMASTQLNSLATLLNLVGRTETMPCEPSTLGRLSVCVCIIRRAVLQLNSTLTAALSS